MSQRRIFKWTPFQLDKLNQVQEVLASLEEYNPLTLRQVYYQLVSKGYIENKVSEYGMLSGLVKQARLSGFIPWEDIEDRVRAFHNLTGWKSPQHFIQISMNNFLSHYERDLMQSQDVYIELWIEKDALSSIFINTVRQYTIPVTVCRGFSSVSFLNDYKNRLSYYPDKKPILLYFGDFDPSGVEMLKAMETTLRDELNVEGIEFKRCALLKEDIELYHLPHSPDALKKTDTRARKHIAEYGELAVELDALRPDILVYKIKEAIETELDIIKFNNEVEKNKRELDMLATMKGQVIQFMDSLW